MERSGCKNGENQPNALILIYPVISTSWMENQDRLARIIGDNDWESTYKKLNLQTAVDKVNAIGEADEATQSLFMTRLMPMLFVFGGRTNAAFERIKENKSLVDIRLTTGTCREYYQNQVDSFILVSSDSDYWGLYGLLKNVDYYVMVEESKFGHANKTALMDAGIPFCYIDDFCTGNSNQIKVQAMLREVRKSLDNALKLNVKEMLHEAYCATRADMSDAERRQFYNRYIKTMRLLIGDDGEVTIALEGDNFR